MTTRVPRPKLESLGRGWGYGGARTHHGEGGEGLRDEAGDRGGEHSLLGHGSLGDGGLGDWIRRGIRGLGISSDRGNLVERARAGTNSRRGGFDRFARFAIGWFGCTHRWPCGQPCGPRALREGEERGEGSRSALASSPDRGEGRELVNNRRARRKMLRKEAGGGTIRAPFASDRAGTHWQRPRTSWRGTCRPFCVWLLRCLQLVSCAIMPRARTRSAVKNTPHGGSQLDVSIGRAPSQPIRSRSSGGQDIDFWHLCG